jgi:Tat protein translocase TatB subunit
MFGIGTPELLVILIVALVVVGPQRLPELGRTVGRALREFRKVQDEVRGMVKEGIGNDLDDVRKEIRGTADEVRRTSREITGGVKEATDVQALLPKAKRGPHRTRRPGAMLGGAAGEATPPRDLPTRDTPTKPTDPTEPVANPESSADVDTTPPD